MTTEVVVAPARERHDWSTYANGELHGRDFAFDDLRGFERFRSTVLTYATRKKLAARTRKILLLSKPGDLEPRIRLAFQLLPRDQTHRFAPMFVGDRAPLVVPVCPRCGGTRGRDDVCPHCGVAP